MTTQQIKQALLEKCFDFVGARKQKILHLIKGIEESLFEEGKSTAGDKHHTGRAMLQIDRENAGKQLMEIEKLEKVTHRINLENAADIVKVGSLVITEKARYFLSISAGAVTVKNDTYFCISPASPIGALLLGKQVSSSFSFNGTSYTISKVC